MAVRGTTGELSEALVCGPEGEAHPIAQEASGGADVEVAGERIERSATALSHGNQLTAVGVCR